MKYLSSKVFDAIRLTDDNLAEVVEWVESRDTKFIRDTFGEEPRARVTANWSVLVEGASGGGSFTAIPGNWLWHTPGWSISVGSEEEFKAGYQPIQELERNAQGIFAPPGVGPG